MIASCETADLRKSAGIGSSVEDRDREKYTKYTRDYVETLTSHVVPHRIEIGSRTVRSKAILQCIRISIIKK